jgi:hypothetical protein
MSELVRGGIYQPGLQPEIGDCIVLDTDSGPADFFVYRIGKRILCEENREANKRELWFDDENDLRWHTLRREALYALMAGDFGIAGPVVCLDRGIWELGKKNITGKGRAKVLFAEQGVGENDLVACVSRHGFKLNCLLFHGKAPTQFSVPEKNIVTSQILVDGGRFVTEVFEDLEASGRESIPETGVDLDSTPQKVVIMGEEFAMPLHQGKPLIGLKYLAALFDRARESIPVWELFLEGHPGDEDNETDDSSDDSEAADSGMVVTGTKRQDKRVQIHPSWDDVDMDDQSRREIGRELKAKQKLLEELTKKGIKSGRKVEVLKQDIADFEKHLNKGSGAGGRRRAIKHTDRDKARDSVRNGLNVVIGHVEKRNSDKGKELRDSIDFGYEMMFKPPPEWGI